MLCVLHIENIALIEQAELQLGEGLNVLTGETGAGKSIVLDAISALTGERVSRELIRTGQSAAFVSGLFTLQEPLPILEELGIELGEERELSLSRRISADGKNVCRIAGRPCTTGELRTLGRQLIQIHGQHDSRQLLDEHTHLRYLDGFGRHESLLAEQSAAYTALSVLHRRMGELQMDEAEKARRMDVLSFQIDDIEGAALCPGEMEELAARRTLLRNSGKLTEAVDAAHQALSGDEEQEGAVDQLALALHALENAAAYAEDIAALAGELTELRYTAIDFAERVRDLRDRFDFSPEELDRLEGRLDQLYRLSKKYGESETEMLAYLEDCRAQLDAIQMADDSLARLQRDYEAQLQKAKDCATRLHEARVQSAEHLRVRIEEELHGLDMPKVRFAAQFAPKGGALGLDKTGADEVVFLMSANLGEELRPLHKVASGGELSRIMLALQNVLAESDPTATLIFDEVDAGISGRAAEKVAQKMGELAARRQILCVTHLAQIAAMADLHISVQKGEREERTHTELCLLDEQARIAELARLTGGSHLSEAILAGARELREKASSFKSSLA